MEFKSTKNIILSNKIDGFFRRLGLQVLKSKNTAIIFVSPTLRYIYLAPLTPT